MRMTIKENTEKGSMTVVMSLLLMMVLALILGLLESARMQSARAQLLANADMGMFSLLGTYDRNLLEWYDVFFLDGGMETDTVQTEELSGLLGYYCGVPSKDRDGIWQDSWTGLSMEAAEVSAVLLAADAEGSPFLWQAVLYAKEQLAFSALETVTYAGAEEYLRQGEDKLAQADSVSGQIEEIRDMGKRRKEAEYKAKVRQAEAAGEVYTGKPDYSNLEFENPIRILKRLMQTGVTDLAGMTVSGSGIQEKDLMSQRSRVSGWGVIEKQPDTGTVDRTLFNEYILDKLPCFTDDATASANTLQYQTEYVLSGAGTDKENLENVLKQLLVIRFGLNLSTLTASGECVGKAGTMAAAIAASSGLAILEPVMKTAILLLWALEESFTDIRTLCVGGTVELMKSAEDFMCPVEELFSFRVRENTGSKNGMDYKGYLRWLLAAVPLKTRIYRCMDMVEHSIRENGDRPGFRMDTQVFALKAKVKGHVRTMFLPSAWNGGELNTIITGSYYTGG